MSDFFETHTGNAIQLKAMPLPAWRVCDRFYDVALRVGGRLARVRKEAALRAPSRVLMVGVEVPSRAQDIHQTMQTLREGSRHEIVQSIAPMGQRGKFQNIDAAIDAAPESLHAFDWLVVTDDDIAFAPHFLDDLIALAEAADLSVAMPAHAFESHAMYAITKRHLGSLVRRTSFVEIGPLTLIRADAFGAFIPFPESRWCYGIDLVWGELADRLGLRIGIVDGTPVRHLRPVAAAYNIDAAIAEGRDLLRRFDVRRNRAEVFARNQVVLPAR